MLTDWVTGGGNLIAMRPDPQLAGLLGLTDIGSARSRTATSRSTRARAPGAGIVGETIQFHGTADRYTLTGATTVATLYSNATTATSNPAVTLRSVGVERRPGGGLHLRPRPLGRLHAPGQPGLGRAGARRPAGPIRSDDLFFGAAAGDPQPDWVDLDKVAIPQADEQQRLLANLIGEHEPRPQAAAALLVLPARREGGRGDDRRRPRRAAAPPAASTSTRPLSPAGCSVADWECVRGTSYIYPNTPLTDAPGGGLQRGRASRSGSTSDDQLRELHPGVARPGTTTISSPTSRVEYPSVPAPSTNRTHCIAWSDWATQPKVELDHGIRFDTNYYYWPPDVGRRSGRACSPARGCRCASPISTAR